MRHSNIYLLSVPATNPAKVSGFKFTEEVKVRSFVRKEVVW